MTQSMNFLKILQPDKCNMGAVANVVKSRSQTETLPATGRRRSRQADAVAAEERSRVFRASRHGSPQSTIKDLWSNHAKCGTAIPENQPNQGRQMKRIAIMLGVSLFSWVGLAEADLSINGDFETGDLTGWTAAPSNTYVGTDPLVLYVGPGSGFTGAPGYLGNYVANFGGGGDTGGVLSQSIATTIDGQYVLSFDYGGFQTAAFGEPQSLSIAANGASLGTVTGTGGSQSGDLSDVFQHYTETFIATGTSTALSFSDLSLSGDSSDGMLDDVNAVATTPEPAYFPMVAGGLCLLSFFANRQSRKAALAVPDGPLS